MFFVSINRFRFKSPALRRGTTRQRKTSLSRLISDSITNRRNSVRKRHVFVSALARRSSPTVRRGPVTRAHADRCRVANPIGIGNALNATQSLKRSARLCTRSTLSRLPSCQRWASTVYTVRTLRISRSTWFTRHLQLHLYTCPRSTRRCCRLVLFDVPPCTR